MFGTGKKPVLIGVAVLGLAGVGVLGGTGDVSAQQERMIWYPDPEFDLDQPPPNGLFLSLSEEFAREGLRDGKLTSRISTAELSRRMLVSTGEELGSRGELVCGVARVRDGRTVAVKLSRVFAVGPGRISAVGLGRISQVGTHCVPGDQWVPGNQFIPGDQWIQGDQWMVDGREPGGPPTNFQKTFGTRAARAMQHCCVGKHDALVMAVFPAEAERAVVRPLVVLLSPRR